MRLPFTRRKAALPLVVRAYDVKLLDRVAEMLSDTGAHTAAADLLDLADRLEPHVVRPKFLEIVGAILTDESGDGKR